MNIDEKIAAVKILAEEARPHIWCFMPQPEVHRYVSAIDPEFMLNLIARLEAVQAELSAYKSNKEEFLEFIRAEIAEGRESIAYGLLPLLKWLGG